MCISLRPYNFFMRSNVNLGSFGVTGVKRTFSAKLLLLLQNTWCYLYVTQCIYVAHKYALTWDSLLHSMGQGQITSSGRVRHLWWQMCLVLLSSFFFLLTICFFSRMLNWISTKLGQNDQWVSGYKSYQQFDLKGHVGVTGVKKVNHMKNMKTALISKLIMSSCRQQTKLQKSQWWPCHTTPHIGVKGQNVSYFQFF